MANITIYKRQYTLPVLETDRFEQLQRRIRERQQMIQQGKRAQQIEESYNETLAEQAEPVGLFSRLFGIQAAASPRVITKTRMKTQVQDLSAEERFALMKELMSEYVTMLGMLDAHKVEYDRLLVKIGDDIRLVAAEKCQKYLATDADLTRLEQDALADHDDSDVRSLQADRGRLIQTIRVLGQAILLITKKIDLFRAGLNKIADDQELKKTLVDKKLRKLNRQYEMYLVKQKIVEYQKEVSEMLKVALNFEELMRECFGPLQALIEEVTGMDGAFAGAVEEIKNLTRVMLTDDSGALAANALNDAEEELLNFLMRSQLQREQLADVVNSAWQAEAEAEFDADMAQGEAVSVRQALENLRTFLDARLPVNSGASQSGASNLDLTPAQSRLRAPVVVELGGGVTLELMEIPGGTFWMGQSDDEQRFMKQQNWWNDYFNCERPRHQVTVAPFLIGKYPITQAQWQAVMGNNPSNWKDPNRPVENVSWNDCQAFVQKLNATHPSPLPRGEQHGTPLLGGAGGGLLFRLPTEAEWEYACRAGSETIYAFGDDPAQLGDYAWFSENSGKETHPVGQKQPNNFGLHDMHGNVWEWCVDTWHDNYNGAPNDGSAWGSLGDKKAKVLRGGSWHYNQNGCRSACRGGLDPDDQDCDNGCRVVAVPLRTS